MNHIPKHRTAILVFAHSSQEELKHKKITNGTSLFDALTQQALKTVQRAGIPYFHFIYLNCQYFFHLIFHYFFHHFHFEINLVQYYQNHFCIC